MTNLISGKEALIALANGEEVEWTHFSVGEWHKVPQKTAKLQYFLDDDLGWKFRMKPKTIMLNGIAVPKPQENMPEKGDDVFTLDFTWCKGYVSWTCQSSINTFDRDWWRSEDEVKQVVAALRKIFKTD